MNKTIRITGKQLLEKMGDNKPLKLTFVCTDRLNETKRHELDLDVACDQPPSDKREFNKVLMEKLKQFQHEVNDLVSTFVDKEKQALSDKRLSNDHLKKAQKAKSTEEESSSGEEDENASTTTTSSNKPTETTTEFECTFKSGADDDAPENGEKANSVVKRTKDIDLNEHQHEPAEKKLCLNNE